MPNTELPPLPEPQNPEHAAAQHLARTADQFSCSGDYGQFARLYMAAGVAAALEYLDAHAPRAPADDEWSTEALWAQAARSGKVWALAEQVLFDVFAGDREIGTNTASVLLDVALSGLGNHDDDDSRFVRGYEWLAVNPQWAPTVVAVHDVSVEKL